MAHGKKRVAKSKKSSVMTFIDTKIHNPDKESPRKKKKIKSV